MEPQTAPTRSATQLGDVLAEMLQGFRRPAVVLDALSRVVCMSTAAMHSIEPKPRTASDDPGTDPTTWPKLATFTADNQTFHLVVPEHERFTAPGPALPVLPPRLAKIASLVIVGCTDKQIAQQTGLTFSTVRTYVRQIYRRLGVHSRVGLVHASGASNSPRLSNG